MTREHLARGRDDDAEKYQGGSQQEALVAPHAPLQPADAFRGGKTHRLLRLGSGRPGIDGVLEGHAVHGLERAIEARAVAADRAPKRAVTARRPGRTMRAGSRTNSPPVSSAMPTNWPRCTKVQIPLAAYAAKEATWSLASADSA